jgi:hypothetical protein
VGAGLEQAKLAFETDKISVGISVNARAGIRYRISLNSKRILSNNGRLFMAL